MKKRDMTKIVKVLKGIQLAFFIVLMMLILFMSTRDYYAYSNMNLFGVRLGIVDMVGFLYTLWLMFVNWMEEKYLPEKKRSFWNTALILFVGALVIFRILYAMNP